MALVFHQLMK